MFELSTINLSFSPPHFLCHDHRGHCRWNQSAALSDVSNQMDAESEWFSQTLSSGNSPRCLDNRFKRKIYHVFQKVENIYYYTLYPANLQPCKLSIAQVNTTSSLPTKFTSNCSELELSLGVVDLLQILLCLLCFWHCPHEPNDRTWKESGEYCAMSLLSESFESMLGTRHMQLLSSFRATSQLSWLTHLAHQRCSPPPLRA